MANQKPVGVSYSDPELTAGTTIAGGTVNSAGALSGASLDNTTINATTAAPGSFTNASQNGSDTHIPQILVAAGATQGTAGVITKSRVIVTVTASTQGVKLPTAVTGLEVAVRVPGTVGVKVYPFAGDKIDAASTNSAQALVAGKGNIFLARDAVTWVTIKGA